MLIFVLFIIIFIQNKKKMIYFFILLSLIKISIQTTGIGYWLTEAAEKDDARCLDGTPAVYYHMNGTDSGVNKWYIHQELGGWCYNLEDCYMRSKSSYGSSVGYEKTWNDNYGYFNKDPQQNPLMYNWNMIYIKYCDGASFSGSNSSRIVYKRKTLYFRGKHILDAVIKDLL